MMKKILSIILTVCMLFSLVIVPVTVNAEEVTYDETTLGSYYKFTFGEDEMYNYVKDAKVEYKGKEFTPLYYQYGTGASAGYKKIIDSETGDEYDTLQLQSGSNIMFTPLTKDRKPFEMKPGVSYTYKVNMSKMGVLASSMNKKNRRIPTEKLECAGQVIEFTTRKGTTGEIKSKIGDTEYTFLTNGKERIYFGRRLMDSGVMKVSTNSNSKVENGRLKSNIKHYKLMVYEM
jgi:hypothetical protein